MAHRSLWDCRNRTISTSRKHQVNQSTLYYISRHQGQQKSLKGPQNSALAFSILEIYNTGFADQSSLPHATTFEGTKKTQKRGGLAIHYKQVGLYSTVTLRQLAISLNRGQLHVDPVDIGIGKERADEKLKALTTFQLNGRTPPE